MTNSTIFIITDIARVHDCQRMFATLPEELEPMESQMWRNSAFDVLMMGIRELGLADWMWGTVGFGVVGARGTLRVEVVLGEFASQGIEVVELVAMEGNQCFR